MIVIVFFALIAATSAGVINHGDGLGHEQATSYQHVNIESYHPVPVYIKKEDTQFLAHPVSQGHISTSVEVQHGQHYGHGHEGLSAGFQDAGLDSSDGGHQSLNVAPVHEEAGLGGQYGGGFEYSAQDGQASQGYELAGHQESAGYGQQDIGDGGYGHQNAAIAFEHSSVVDHEGASHYH